MAKRIAKIAIFTALAMIFSYIEAIIPFNFGIPGVKIGIANIVIVIALYKFGVKETVGISFIRIFLIGLLFGNIVSLIYSFSGAALSLIGMIICKRLKLSIVGVSAIGGVLHNIGQLTAAAVILQSTAITYYFPVLLISGLVTGLLIGAVSMQINKALIKLKI
ncbi:MAG: Gx transporter family protein [Ruminococcus sp.]|nr:Gx transporter family protein [Ruminococcus sp.]